MSNITKNVLPVSTEDRQYLEDQRTATLNILEDITEVQEELKYKYKHTQVLSSLLQRLTTTINPVDIMGNMLDSFEELLDFDTVAFVIGEYKSRKQASNLYIYSKTLVGRSYLEATRQAFLDYIGTMPGGVKNVESLKKQLRGRLYYEFIKGSIRSDESLGKLPVSGFIVPIILKEEEKDSTLLGAFYISTISDQSYTQTQIDIARDIASLVAFNIERINTMIRSEYSRISNLVDSMTNGVVVFNKARIVTLANPVIEKMTGLPCSSSSSSSSLFPLEEFTRLFSEIDLEGMVRKVLDTGFALRVEEAKLLRFYYEMFVIPIRDYDNNITAGAIIMHDITHMREVDRMKTEFVSIASHQLRTPLTAMKLFVEMLANEEVGKLNKEQKDYVTNIQESSRRMIELVNDLLNVSRLETGRLKIEPKMIQLGDFIRTIINEVDPVAKEKKCRLVYKRPKSKLKEIPLDANLTRQVINNLIMNAIRYSPARQCDIMVQLEQKDDNYVVCISDKGIGIPKNAQSRVFEKFYRADNAVKIASEGSGLGLYVAKMVMESAGGKIWFESPPKGEKRGTAFYISIPIEGMQAKKGPRSLA